MVKILDFILSMMGSHRGVRAEKGYDLTTLKRPCWKFVFKLINTSSVFLYSQN